MVMHLPSPGGTRPLSMSLECTWGPKMVKEATCFLCFPFLRLNIFVGGMAGGLNVLLTGGRLGSVVWISASTLEEVGCSVFYAVPDLCNVAGFALGWHFGLSLNWKANKYTVSYPKKMGRTFCCTPEVGTFPWAMSLVAALVAFQFQPLGLYPKRQFLHRDRWPPLPPK